jgi:hypothetical protein
MGMLRVKSFPVAWQERRAKSNQGESENWGVSRLYGQRTQDLKEIIGCPTRSLC